MKSKKEILEELINEQNYVIINKEVAIGTLKKMNPDDEVGRKLDGSPMIAKERMKILQKELEAEKLRLETLNEFLK
jgi:hypothetical protein